MPTRMDSGRSPPCRPRLGNQGAVGQGELGQVDGVLIRPRQDPPSPLRHHEDPQHQPRVTAREPVPGVWSINK